ncbi:MAG TPA: LysR substrate-binding domain-containing protein [Geminicoccaceae bacterium]|nr:LysR substrate-binding domain-containing protein [Geminicoccaceae bacterium]
MYELSQLRCFVAVAEDLHFGHAAARLHMTQPPLSRQVQLLEHALDVRLLERNSRSVRLTPAGRAFLPEARRILRLADEAALAAKRVARGEAGSVTIGFTAGASYDFVPRLVSLALAELPDVDLILKEMVSRDQLEALSSNRIDIGLVRLPVDRRGLELVCVAREPLLIGLPSSHPLATGRDPTIRDIDRQPFIMYSPGEGRYFYDLLASVFRSADVMPNYVQYISQTHTILALVSAGLGLALVPESARNLRFDGVVLRPIHLGPKTYSELFLVWRRNNENPALRIFHSLVLRKIMEGHT